MNVSPLTSWLRDLLAASRLGDERGLPLEDAVAERADFSRRQFLRGAAALGSGVVASRRLGPPSVSPAPDRRTSPRVVIVGAGLAGLRCAHVLSSQYGVTATLYEAADRVGGRCWSLRDYGAVRSGHRAADEVPDPSPCRDPYRKVRLACPSDGAEPWTASPRRLGNVR